MDLTAYICDQTKYAKKSLKVHADRILEVSRPYASSRFDALGVELDAAFSQILGALDA